jgi:hypothetical protein
MSVDWDKVGWPPELLARVQAAPKPARIKRSTELFTKFPQSWEDRLSRARSPSTYRVALHLLRQYWQTDQLQFDLANGGLELKGVDRHAKQTALRELERAGLILVQRRPRKSPTITLLVRP